MSAQSHYATCTLCEAMCGIEVRHDGDQILSIKGDKLNPFSQGYLCPKASSLKDLYEDPKRLRQPHQRVNGQWQPVSWETAIDKVVSGLLAVQRAHGDDAVGVYLGNPNAHNMGSLLYGPAFYRALNTRNRFSATSVDQLPHHVVSRLLFGHQLQIPIPDIDHTQCMVILGGNPLASNGSIMSVANVRQRLKAIQQRGGQVIVIDPKRTETAQMASDHLFIRPGADVLLLLSMLCDVFERDLVNPEHLSDYLPEWQSIGDFVAAYPPERTAIHTGVSPDSLRALVDCFCHAPSAVLYGRMGASVQAFGTLNQYLIMLFNMLTGNLDRRGGMMFTQPAADHLSQGGHGAMARHHSRVRQLPSFAGEFPVACLAEEILTPGEGQIRAMVIAAGNPVISTPNADQLSKALSQLDFLVAIDFYLNESNANADIILPPVSPLERDHYDLVFHKLAVRNFATFSPALFSTSEAHKSDWQIYLMLAEKLLVEKYGNADPLKPLQQTTPSGIIDNLLRHGRYANSHELSIDTLKANPHGIDLGPLQPDLPNALFTESNTIELHLQHFFADLKRVEEVFFDTPYEPPHHLWLIGRRHLKSNNSWLHHVDRLVKGNNRCDVQMHPHDAANLGIEQDETVILRSERGEIRLPVDITEDIMPGVVSVPHGWGHDVPETWGGEAFAVSGVNVNRLTDDRAIDALSGNAVLNGVPVTAHKVRAPASS
ncbi:molybdopterin-dependent oxidoreductase [Aestuariibacter halophilus]|uniref:Molybdopterin-dependent oxidoreductase n=1 Tax=Fluctibacter halophilus TaxID=226011 RepID=A0ABS8G4A2_9ALTE|nr:molybdopterin-dependent oxidoreductase [Aestuariibacter halophilus]MCC2615355.1 molybdopterin-dependent oxidoreductase [Aestuariibacter halophilus]